VNDKRKTTGLRRDRDGLSRRDFLKRAAAVAAAPLIVPSSVLGLEGHTAPSDRVTTAIIGNGSCGGGVHVPQDSLRDDIEMLAVCDVQRDRREKARKAIEDSYGQRQRPCHVKAYNDFREILARRDIDAVTVVPLHYWHSVMAIMAAQAGKHVYVEKMCSVTLGEARALGDAVERYGIVLQHGTQGRSGLYFRHATELVKNGRIGKVLRVEVMAVDFPPVRPGRRGPVGAPMGRGKEVPVPDGLDWDLYLGPCPWRPYEGDLDVGGVWFGSAADFGIHPVDSAQMVAGLDGTGPIEIYPGGTGGYERLMCKYANGVEFTAFKPGDPDQGDFGIRVTGTEGTIAVDRGRCKVTPAYLDRRPVGPDDWRVDPTVSQPVWRAASSVVASNTRKGLGDEDSWGWLAAHKTNWLRCIRTGRSPPLMWSGHAARRRSAS